ncbi:MAG TPA: N-acetylneuraminate synthase [Chryseosolibacter sp.]
MKKVLIIAEAGVNHNGSFELAKKMVDLAFEAGADIVKFQTAIPELVMSAAAPKAEYQSKNTGSHESQLEMSRKIHLPLEAYKDLKHYCEAVVGIKFLSTAFDEVSLDLLNGLGMDIFKIPSGEITNLPYLEKVAKFNREVILSTGMARLGEIEFALNVLTKNGISRDRITVLHCNTDYPTPYHDVNLRAMKTIGDAFGVSVGYSDHTQGIEVSIAAVAMGAEVIEKHFTLDKSMEGPDHIASLSPQELKDVVKAIRNIEQAMGDGIKQPTPSESKNITIARRSIHLRHDVKEGAVLTEKDLIMKRPGDGISPIDMRSVAGKKVKKSLPADHKIQWTDLD